MSVLALALLVGFSSPYQGFCENQATGTGEMAGEQAKRDRGYERASMRSDEELGEEISGTLVSFIQNTVQGDLEGVVDNFYKPDRDRLDNAAPAGENLKSFADLGDTLDKRWNEKFGNQFTDELKGVHEMVKAATMSRISDKQLSLQFASQSSSGVTVSPVTLRLVDEGIIGEQWRIDVPDSLDRPTLRSRLEQELERADREIVGSNQPMSTAIQLAALRLIGTVGTNYAQPGERMNNNTASAAPSHTGHERR